MKTLNLYSIVLGVIASLFIGCSSGLLDLTPEMSNVVNSYYKDAQQFRKGLNAAYGILQSE